jgi:hypothetical protein
MNTNKYYGLGEPVGKLIDGGKQNMSKTVVSITVSFTENQ